MFQPRWCVLTNSQLIIYKDEHLSQRQSAERFTEQMTATRFSCHDAVTLHFYDMVMGSTQGEGSVQPLGTGNFHVGIEINGG
ncbi:unnamed protein product, partial [Durusdinium trenchii]